MLDWAVPNISVLSITVHFTEQYCSGLYYSLIYNTDKYCYLHFSPHYQLPSHCEILGTYMQQDLQHHVFRALLKADPHSQTEAHKEERLLCLISRYKLTASEVTDISSLTCRAR